MKSDIADFAWLERYSNQPTANPKVIEHIQQCHDRIEEMLDPAQIKFLVVPGQYLYAEDLSFSEKFLMSFIHMADQKRHCWAKDKSFAKWMGCSEKTIKNMMVQLKKKGYISTVSYNGKKRVLKCAK